MHLIHRKDWEAVAKDGSPYLGYDHLKALEDVMAGTMQFRYAIFHCAKYRPVGIACFQIVDLEDNGSAYGDRIRKFGTIIGSRIISELKVRSLVCGNAFHCGTHGAHFTKDIPCDHQMLALEMAMEQLRADERLVPRISVSIFKDLGVDQLLSARVLEDKGYHPLAMDVSMRMNIAPAWKDLDGYLEALTAKARTRIRSIQGRSSEVEVRDLSAEEIKRSIPALQQLFDQVLERSPFIFGRLSVSIFAQWKAIHGDRFLFHGFYLNGVLIGFSSAFSFGDTLDAQLVGLDYQHNEKHMVYQRILLDLLISAFKLGARAINFGRTAEQAKSSIGALPVQLPFYVKHRNRVANRLIGPFLRKVEPAEFEQRSPFRKPVL